MNQEQTEEELPPSKRLKLDNDILALNNDIIGTEIDFTGDNIDLGDKKFVINDVDYSNFVNPEELERLREFKVLDEVKSNDEDSNDDETSSFDGKSDGLPEDEIEKMLEEDLPDGFKGAPKPKEKPYVTHQKVVLEEKGVNPFEVLPLDWIMVRHYSGMPIYMHRPTRVCTISKPYFLGKGNTRRHDVPISAIPCLAYRRALEEEAKQKVIDKKIEEQIRNGTWRNTDKQTQQTHTGNLAINSSNKENGSEENSAHSYQSIEGSTHSEENIALPDQNIVALTHSVEKGALPDQNIVALTHSEEKGALPDQNIVELTHSEEKGALPDQNIVASTEESSNTNQEIPRCPFSAIEASQGTPPADGDQEIPSNRQPVVLPGGIVMLPPRVESVNTSWKTQHLTPDNINEYCKNLFKFKTVNIMHFKRWADRRKYTKARKTLQYPTLPKGTKLITIPAQPAAGQQNGGGKANKRDWVMNMNGRSYLSVFHEYVHQALQKQPVYEFKQLQNASTPYQATVFIGGMQYGVGHGSSKRQAKSAAARASIHILIPEMKDDMDAHAHSRPDPDSAEPDFTFFDNVGIEDPRITEFCAATCEPSPHAILRTCLVRNFGAGDRHIHTEMKKLEYQKVELTMKVGKHSATVACKNKKTAKQRASQAILQALHPHVRSWGSLLRLYGSRSMKSCKEKKQEEQQITLLQDQARHNQPNHAVLRKLRHEMARLRDRDRAVVPIGTLLLAHDLPTHSGSNLNNVDL